MSDQKIIFSMVGVSKVYKPNKRVLNDIYLSFFYGAKIGVLGLNGAGKSTLLKIIAGLDEDYIGDISRQKGTTFGYLDQEPELDESKTVREIVEQGVQETMDLLKEYEVINEKFSDPDADFDALIAKQS
ncbi:MAG: ATP-binding cassette domain-containing protein, partial [Balneolaceae bacterium]